MFRRSSKLTAVLVAAASMAQFATPAVQVMAADRLGTKEGTIDNARAFDGGYIYDGYRTDDDDAALYYNNGSKDVNTDEDEDYDDYELSRYGEKYATVKDGDDVYLIDLSNGKIDNDETVKDKTESARNSLKSKINKEDRYENFKADGSTLEIEDKVSAGTNSFAKILNNKYGEVWYQYSAKGDSDAKDRTTDAAAGYYQGFTNSNGKYIDVTQDANIYAYDTDAKKTVKIEEYGKTYGKNDLKAQFKSTEAIAQDKDYLYLLTTVVISGKNQNDSEQIYFQKVSKAQGLDKDGGKLPKSTTSYQVNNKVYGKDRIYNDSDAETAADLIEAYMKDNAEYDERKVENIEVIDNALYVTTVKTDNIKMYKLKFKKAKLDTYEDVNNDKRKKEDVDVYTIQKDADWDNDTVDVKDSKEGKNYSIDKDGNTWILNKGKILKVDGTDFKEVYTCDRSLDKLDVYDEKNLIAWCSDGDVYTTVAEGEKETQDEDNTTKDPENNGSTTEAQVGWVKNADSTWSYYKDGAKATGWVQDGAWYYLDAAGIMKTGWQQVGGVWYFLNTSGAMQTGWVNDNGTWYYCNASGAMLANQWFQDSDGRWYYLQASGAMAVNTVIGGYVIGANGAWVK